MLIMSMISFFSISLSFVSLFVFLTKLLSLGILFLTAVNVEVVAKPQMLGISFLTFHF